MDKILPTALPTALIGGTAGIISAVFGADQADTILPGLVLTGIIPDFKKALGTTLLAIMPPTNIGAVYKFYKKGRVNIGLAVILMISATIASYFGADLVNLLTDQQQKIGLGIYLICVAIFQFYSASKITNPSKANKSN